MREYWYIALWRESAFGKKCIFVLHHFSFSSIMEWNKVVRGGAGVKNLNMLVWLTQLGLSVAMPPVGFIWMAVWMRDAFGWGQWVIWTGVVLGLVCAFEGLRTSMKTMEKMSGSKPEKEAPVSFNDHD